MPRQPRIEIPGVLYHIIARGIERRRLYKDSHDKKMFLKRLAGLVDETGIICYAWVLMPNHFHLLVSPTKYPLHNFMHRLQTGYAVNFNHRHKRAGHLFQNRYKSIICQKENYFQQLIRYIHRNPLQAGLVKNLSALDAYPWCGHSALVGNTSHPWYAEEETLSYFGEKIGKARSAYRQFISEFENTDAEDRFCGGGLIRSAGGWKVVKANKKAGGRWAGDERILGESFFVQGVLKQLDTSKVQKNCLAKESWDFKKIVEYVIRRTGAESRVIEFKCKGKAGAEARAMVAYLCRYVLDMQVTEIGNRLGINQSAASQLIAKGRVSGGEDCLGDLLGS